MKLIRTPPTRAEAVESGAVVKTECACTLWWLVPVDVGSRCGHCDEPMVVRPTPESEAEYRTEGAA